MEKPLPSKAPTVDHNKECWSAFYKNEEDAKRALEKITTKLSETHLIVSAKVKFVTKYKDGNVYEIHIVKAKK